MHGFKTPQHVMLSLADSLAAVDSRPDVAPRAPVFRLRRDEVREALDAIVAQVVADANRSVEEDAAAASAHARPLAGWKPRTAREARERSGGLSLRTIAKGPARGGRPKPKESEESEESKESKA